MTLFGMIVRPSSRESVDATLRSFFRRTPLDPADRFLLIDHEGGYVPPDDVPADRITCLRLSTQASFAADANVLVAAARQHDADLILLSSGLLFTDGWLPPLLSNRRALISSVSNMQVEHRLDGWNVGPEVSWAECAGREALLDRIGIHHHQQARGVYQVEPAVAFYCVKISRAACRAIGSFDESLSGEVAARDYTLRAWLAGFRTELALESYVLRVGAGHAATPADAGRRPDAPETTFDEGFHDRWGAALTYAFLGGDWNLFRSDPELGRLLASRQYGRVVERLMAVPTLDRFVERQQRASFGAVCCVYDDDAWLQAAVASAYAACKMILFLIGDRPWNGEPSDQEPLLARIRALPDPAGKLRIVRGCWRTETDQRNDGLRLLAEAGIDYCFVLDADEIHEPDQLRRAMDLVRVNPQVDCWRMYCWTYWKSCRYVIDPPQDYAAAVFVRVDTCRFFDNRNCHGDRVRVIPADVAMFHHMSYARTDAQVRRKITTFGDAGRLRPEWYEQVWRGWDVDHAVEDLNPCYPGAYRRAVEQPRDALPPILRPLWESSEASGGPAPDGHSDLSDAPAG